MHAYNALRSMPHLSGTWPAMLLITSSINSAYMWASKKMSERVCTLPTGGSGPLQASYDQVAKGQFVGHLKVHCVPPFSRHTRAFQSVCKQAQAVDEWI